ncbi:MAG TPA: acylphosphatase [Tepidisphaeraceae bacterium]|nr:acylphosphatase [Tepidisphaeraceae bacterium]
MRCRQAHPTERCHCFFDGKVQGVGFRYTAQNLALNFDVCGYVRNLPDGRVELVVEGEPREVHHFIDDLKQRMGDYIRNAKIEPEPPTGEFSRFQIAF